MKIEFPRIVRIFPLSDYAPEISGEITVWVNPPRKLINKLADRFQENVTQRTPETFNAFTMALSELLSQGKPETHWTAAELQELVENTMETDPAFWMWLNNRIIQEIDDYRSGVKKN